MGKPHYIIRRSRLGRFNFTFITEAGRITGFVQVPLQGQTPDELALQAKERIREIARSFVGASDVDHPDL